MKPHMKYISIVLFIFASFSYALASEENACTNETNNTPNMKVILYYQNDAGQIDSLMADMHSPLKFLFTDFVYLIPWSNIGLQCTPRTSIVPKKRGKKHKHTKQHLEPMPYFGQEL